MELFKSLLRAQFIEMVHITTRRVTGVEFYIPNLTHRVGFARARDVLKSVPRPR
jgi:hypothetical protein